MLTIALLCGLIAVLLVISWCDITRRLIPNRWVLLVAVLCLVLTGVVSPSLWAALLQFAPLTITFTLMLLLYLCRIIAGGDVKLAAALAVATPLHYLPEALWLTAIVGGALALFYYIKYRLLPTYKSRMDPGLPYGVAIAIGFYLPICTHSLVG